MIFEEVPVHEALGGLLAHNIFDNGGRRRLKKGTRLTAEHLDLLARLGHARIYIARPEAGDVHENEAAARLARVVTGPGVEPRPAATGRANLKATRAGLLRVHTGAVQSINQVDDGITIATLHCHCYVRPHQLVATVKIIPFAVPEAAVQRAETTAQSHAPVLRVDPLQVQRVGLLVSSLADDHALLLEQYLPPLDQRLQGFDRRIETYRTCRHAPDTIAAGVQELLQAGMDLILIVSMSAIIDRRDVIPRGVELAGGRVEHFGVPVDPGNLLMVAYAGERAIVGVPGCARSPKQNAFDLVLPRLLAGDRLSRQDLVSLGHGGLLEEIRERHQPREAFDD